MYSAAHAKSVLDLVGRLHGPARQRLDRLADDCREEIESSPDGPVKAALRDALSAGAAMDAWANDVARLSDLDARAHLDRILVRRGVDLSDAPYQALQALHALRQQARDRVALGVPSPGGRPDMALSHAWPSAPRPRSKTTLSQEWRP